MQTFMISQFFGLRMNVKITRLNVENAENVKMTSTIFLHSHHHFVNAHGNVFNGDIRCDDSNMIMGVERKWAPTMMKLDAERGGVVSEEPEDNDEESSNGGCNSNIAVSTAAQGTQHFFLEILRTKHGVWHMWIWYLGEPEEAGAFRCEIAIR